VGIQVNQLPDLLRRWFGPRAGHPGTAHRVRFHASPDGLWVEPLLATVVELGARRGVVAYPDLPAAAGHVLEAVEAPGSERIVMLPVDDDDPDLFAVRVSGTSMDGGKNPIRDGDWALMRAARSAPASAFENRVALVQLPAEVFGNQYQIKRLERRGTKWLLTSDNPDGPTFEGGEGMVPIARLERVVRPEDLAPAIGTTMSETELSERFGMDVQPATERWSGHLFIFVDRKGLLESPDRVSRIPVAPRPGETAFVLARRSDRMWRFLGVAHQVEDGAAWRIPEADYETWHDWGEGREVSRRLPEGALARAQLTVDALLSLPEQERWLVGDSGRARLLGSAQRGGLRIAGDEGGFKPRTVSLTDIAWVIAADNDVAEHGGLLDEERVNRLRYLEGTPKGSTRWIDTQWALAAWSLGKGRIREPIVGQVRRDDGVTIDATFRVERVGDVQTIVIESRGGTTGSTAERNRDYAPGLELVLKRLGAAGFRLADAQVESRETLNLPPADRRLDVGAAFPITIDNPAALRKRMSAAQARVGRAPGARGGGNQTRRVRLFVEATGEGLEDRELARRLAGEG
jgi:hypothetical protein